VSPEHYHRYKEDVQLIKALEAKTYRFLDFYSRLVDELLGNGIEPFATIYHWDLPQTLQDRWGGWESHDTAKTFADYASGGMKSHRHPVVFNPSATKPMGI
jgi:beta-glucosidase